MIAELQQIYDTVSAHMLKQRKKAIITSGKGQICVYRTASGLKCAAGCLVPDDIYNEAMEEMMWRHIVRDYPLPDHLKQHEAIELVLRLQRLHDKTEPEEWELGLREIAKQWDLKAI